MKILIAISAAFAILFGLAACQESTTSADDGKGNVSTTFYQVPGCMTRSNSLAEDALRDSCFSYSWDDQLEVEICLSANCCPDVGRFDFSQVISDDMISVTVADTAEQLCDCICLYNLHFEFADLPESVYQFRCYYHGELVYEESLKKP